MTYIPDGWPHCECCGHPLYDFTEDDGTWACMNPECEEYDG